MSQYVQEVGLYVRDQDEALAFYQKLGFRVHTDLRNGEYRWLTLAAAKKLKLNRPTKILIEAVMKKRKSRR